MNTPKQRFSLTPQELDSAVWKKLSAHLNEQLQTARKKNDAVQDIDSTNILRGDIRRIKNLLALNNEPIISVGNR